MCNGCGNDGTGWIRKRRTGWTMQLFRIGCLAAILLIGIGIPELMK